MVAASVLAGTVKLAGDADRLKLAVVGATSTSIAVLPEIFPELPLTVIVYFPDTKLGVAVSVNELVVFVLAGLNAALMPAGRFEAERFTLPLKPFCPLTVMVLVAFAPGISDTLPADATRFMAGDLLSWTTAPQPANSRTIEVRKMTL